MRDLFWNSEEKRIRAFWRLTIQFILFVVAYMLPVLILNEFKNPYTRNLADEIITFVYVLFSIWIVTHFIDKRHFATLGFNFDLGWFLDFLEGMLIGAFVFVIVFIIEYSFGWLKVTADTALTKEVHLIEVVGRFFGYTAVAVMEETFTRGYQIKNIAEGLKTNIEKSKSAIVAALFISSLIFGALHFLNPNSDFMSTFNLFVIGLFYGYAYVISGSLALPIGIHAAWNFVQGNVFGFSVSGLGSEVSILHSFSFGPKIFTGGKFGPEAGIVIYPGIIVGIFILNKIVNKHFFDFSLNERITKYIPLPKKVEGENLPLPKEN